MINGNELSGEEARVIGLLNHGDSQAYVYGRVTPGAWVSFFHGRYLDDKNTHIATFLEV